MSEYVNFVSNEAALVYVIASSHVAGRRQNVKKSRISNAMVWVLWLLLLQHVRAENTCSPTEDNTPEPDWFLYMVAGLIFLVLLMTDQSCPSGEACGGCQCNAKTQKDEAIVPSRLRELLKAEQDRSAQFRAAATEAKRGMELGLEERNQLYHLLSDGAQIMRKMVSVIEDHMEVCPHRVPVMASRQGECWHFDTCHCAEAVVERNRLWLRRCAYCADPRGPLDRLNFELGGCLRDEIQAWLADHDGL